MGLYQANSSYRESMCLGVVLFQRNAMSKELLDNGRCMKKRYMVIISVALLLNGCKSTPSFTEQMDQITQEQYDKGKTDYLGIVTNQAGTLGKYWNWKAGYLAGSLSHNLFNIQKQEYTYKIEGLNVPNKNFTGIDSEIRYESFSQLVETEKQRSVANFESEEELKNRIKNATHYYPNGYFITTAYSITIDSVSNGAVKVIIAQSGKKLYQKELSGIANTPGITGLWSNTIVLPSPNFNNKPFLIRIYQEYSGRYTNYSFTPKS